jgi:hypothetical protein
MGVNANELDWQRKPSNATKAVVALALSRNYVKIELVTSAS